METLVPALLLLFFNIYLSQRCGGFTLFWAAVSFFVPIVATVPLLYWNLCDA
jgi:hypothetical protein